MSNAEAQMPLPHLEVWNNPLSLLPIIFSFVWKQGG